VDSLLLEQDDVVILDMGAGIEHLTRGTSKGVDMMIVVTEPTRTSVQTAKVVQKLAQEIGVEVIKVIGNKIRSPKEEAFLREQFTAQELLGLIHFDDVMLDVALEEGVTEIPEGNFKKALEEIYASIQTKG
ncbi:MAG TPA: hypothetical protein VGC12_08330, partial [Methyloradius sp.]